MNQPARQIRGADPWSVAINEMCEALRLERDEYRSRRRVDVVHLERGRLIDDAEPLATYRFRKQRPKVLPYPRGSAVFVRFEGGEKQWSRVVAQTRRTIDLLLPPRGAETPGAALHWDPAWLVDSLRETLASHVPTPVARALLEGTVERTPATGALHLFHPELDDEQRGALHRLVASRCALLEGPAGTGKTRVLTALVQELRAREESILIVAPSHAACDVITERILEITESDPLHDLGRVVRWGTVQTPTLRAHAAKDQGTDARRGLWIYDGADAEAARAAVREADIVITTTARCHVGNGLLRRFSTVIVDEGGMCSIPMVLVALRYAWRRGVIAGDARQLGPIIHTRGEWLVDRWLRRTPFEVAEESGTVPIARLSLQYRMDALITSVVSDLSYGGRIVAAPSLFARKAKPCGLGADSVYLVDTSELSGRGWFDNPAHAKVIAALVGAIQEPVDGWEDGMLVLARFRRQVACITRACRGARRTERPLLVTTVHSAQGSEAPSVIVDLIPGSQDFLGDYLTDSEPTDDGARVLTVAVSRARERLVVVANVRLLTSRLPPRAQARRLIELLQARATVIPASDVLARW